ncbi:polysaccharide deacetylase family protein [Nocardiopsis ganjiahuensis]|uniref:polysaccharide deacetylase family protein n=1 Tax=Nocardiopsis ganjiahuensis TaxID=239984 RepID=UPI000344F4D6
MHRTTVGTAGGLLITSGLLLGAAAPAAAAPSDVSAKSPDCSKVKCVALTFDDGPGEYTDELLDILEEHNARATFYLLGSKVGSHKAEVRRMAEEGHEVGNHTWKHDDLATLSADEIKDDAERTDEAIAEVTGEKPRTMRPPYGSLDDTAREAVEQPIVLWDVDTLDWQNRDVDKILDITKDETADGSVILLHDIHETSVDAVPGLLDELKGDDFHFVTVSYLFDGDLEAGTAYSDARSG